MAPKDGDPCPECRVGRLQAGRLVDHGGVRFHLVGRWWSWGRRVGGYACDRCGHLALRVAPKRRGTCRRERGCVPGGVDLPAA